MRQIDWMVYAKRPFAGPEAVLACDERGVTFKWKDYRAQRRERYKTLTLAIDEFIRCFLIHVLPQGFHRIRHYGLFATGQTATPTA